MEKLLFPHWFRVVAGLAGVLRGAQICARLSKHPWHQAFDLWCALSARKFRVLDARAVSLVSRFAHTLRRTGPFEGGSGLPKRLLKSADGLYTGFGRLWRELWLQAGLPEEKGSDPEVSLPVRPARVTRRAGWHDHSQPIGLAARWHRSGLPWPLCTAPPAWVKLEFLWLSETVVTPGAFPPTFLQGRFGGSGGVVLNP